MRIALLALAVALATPSSAREVSRYIPPAASRALLAKVDLAAARPIDEAYRAEFARCDGEELGTTGQDTFLGYPTPRPCSTDANRVRALLKLADGGVLWESKMALDVDGSSAATGGKVWRNADGSVRDTTDQCGTALKWREPVGDDDCADPAAQIDPDLYPYAVIPGGSTKFLPPEMRDAARQQFRARTGLGLGDMGVIIVGRRWTPAIIADTGPVYRLGEASSGAFAALGVSRCRQDRVDARGRCIGDGSDRYPYRDSGIEAGAIFIFYPGTAAGLTPENAIAKLCRHAREKLGLSGSPACPK